jgi:tetratricopeptide (TPR) repeat protein
MKTVILFSMLAALSLPIQGFDAAIDLYQHGKFQEAASVLSGLIRQNPEDANLHTWRGKTYLKQHCWDDAVLEFEKAVEIDPKNSLNHLWLARACGKKAEHAFFGSAFTLARRTRKEFETAAQLSPGNVDIRFDLLEFYVQAPWVVGGGKGKAEAQAREIAKLSPRHGYTARAEIYEHSQDWGRARAELTEATLKFPRDADAYADLAGFLLRRGDLEQAEAAARQAVSLAGSNHEARLCLARAQVELHRNVSDALKDLQDLAVGPLTEDDPEFGDVYYWLGRAYLTQGQQAEARVAFEASIRYDPDHAKSKDALAQIRQIP